MKAAALWLLLACADGEPSALPPSRLPAAAPEGRMVKASAVTGYLVRPPGEGPHAATLLLVDAHTDATRSAATDLARQGRVVLAIDPAVDTAAGAAYLAGMPGVEPPSVSCLREACP